MMMFSESANLSWSNASGSSVVVKAAGNSRTDLGTSGSTIKWTVAANAQAPLSLASVSISNKGHSGATITRAAVQTLIPGSTNDLEDFAALLAGDNIDGTYSTTALNILIMDEGINEITCYSNANSTAVNARSLADAYWTYCTNRRSAAALAGASMRILICTCYPGYVRLNGDALNDANAAKCGAAVAAANDLLRAEWRSHCDGLIDLAAHPSYKAIETAGWTAAAFDASGLYVAGDRLHPNDAGNTLVAGIVSNALYHVPR